MLNISRPVRVLFVAAALVLLTACNCGTCNVPPVRVATLPGSTPTPPGVVPTPVVTPTPGAGPACSQGGPDTIALGAAAPFALFANAGITNTGFTTVTYAAGASSTVAPFGTFNDDLIGAYPTSTVTGFGTLTDSGGATAIYATGYNANTAFMLAAQSAVTTAYNAANAELPTAPAFTGGYDLSQVPAGYSGQANCGPAGTSVCPLGTLGAGVYKSASTLSITAGPLTLDGGGNPQSVFVFQVGSALTMAAPNGTMILKNGANGCNIYWADLSGATLGGTASGAAFYGNILAPDGGIVIDPVLTTFQGRALAANAAGASASVSISSGSILTITNPGGN